MHPICTGAPVHVVPLDDIEMYGLRYMAGFVLFSLEHKERKKERSRIHSRIIELIAEGEGTMSDSIV